jgi:hypothetical protein
MVPSDVFLVRPQPMRSVLLRAVALATLLAACHQRPAEDARAPEAPRPMMSTASTSGDTAPMMMPPAPSPEAFRGLRSTRRLDARCADLRSHLASLPASATDPTRTFAGLNDDQAARLCAAQNQGRRGCLLAARDVEQAKACQRTISDAECAQMAAAIFALTQHADPRLFPRGAPPSRDQVEAEVVQVCHGRATEADRRCVLGVTSYDELLHSCSG